MPESNVDVRAQAIRELGEKQFALMMQNTPHRICGLLTARGRSVEWEKAFLHIALHFGPDHRKPSHTVFRKKFCNEAAVKDLVRQAANAPSTVICTKLTIDGVPLGRPGIKIVRAFREPIGSTADLLCLVVIADFQGTLITAFPGTSKEL